MLGSRAGVAGADKLPKDMTDEELLIFVTENIEGAPEINIDDLARMPAETRVHLRQMFLFMAEGMINDYEEAAHAKLLETCKRQLTPEGHDNATGATWRFNTRVPDGCNPGELPASSGPLAGRANIAEMFIPAEIAQMFIPVEISDALFQSANLNLCLRELVFEMLDRYDWGDRCCRLQPKDCRFVSRAIYISFKSSKTVSTEGREVSLCEVLWNSSEPTDGTEPIFMVGKWVKARAHGKAFEIDVPVAVMDALLQFLRANRNKLDKSYVEAAEAGIPAQASFIAPVVRQQTLTESCAQCGEDPATLTRCASCLLVGYCGRACQMDHWRAGHFQQWMPAWPRVIWGGSETFRRSCRGF